MEKETVIKMAETVDNLKESAQASLSELIDDLDGYINDVNEHDETLWAMFETLCEWRDELEAIDMPDMSDY